MAEQVHNHNETRANWRLEYEQIIASIHNIEIAEVGIGVFIIPMISWGLTLERGDTFCLQEIRIIGIISIAICLIHIGCSISIHLTKVARLLERARVIGKLLNGYNNDQNTHISILSRSNIFNYSILFKLIGLAVCGLWISKYKLLCISIYLSCVISICLVIYFFLLKKLRKVKVKK